MTQVLHFIGTSDEEVSIFFDDISGWCADYEFDYVENKRVVSKDTTVILLRGGHKVYVKKSHDDVSKIIQDALDSSKIDIGSLFGMGVPSGDDDFDSSDIPDDEDFSKKN